MVDRKKQPETVKYNGSDAEMPHVVSLKNGTRCYINQFPLSNVVRIDFLFKGGLMQQPKPHTCSMLLQMTTQGTAIRNAFEIASELDHCGSTLQCQTFDNYTSVAAHCTTRHFGRTIDIVEDILKFPAFPTPEFETHKKKIEENIKYALSIGNVIASDKFGTMIFGEDHPQGRPINIENIKNLTIDDVKSFYRNYYNSGNLTIVLSGNISDEIMAEVEKRFSEKWGADTGSAMSTPYKLPETHPGTAIIHNENLVQSSIQAGIITPNRNDDDYQKIRCATYLLGGYYGSRLMQNIREDKGYTYNISASLIGHSDRSYVSIATDCDISYTENVIAEIRNELNGFVKNPVSENELELMRKSMLKGISTRLDNPFSYGKYLASILSLDESPQYINRQIGIIREIDCETLNKIARKYFNPQNLIIAIATK